MIQICTQIQSIARPTISYSIIPRDGIDDNSGSMRTNNPIIEPQKRAGNKIGLSLRNMLHITMQIIEHKFTLFFIELLDQVIVLLFGHFAEQLLETFKILHQGGFSLAADGPDCQE